MLNLMPSGWLEMQVPLDEPLAPSAMKSEPEGRPLTYQGNSHCCQQENQGSLGHTTKAQNTACGRPMNRHGFLCLQSLNTGDVKSRKEMGRQIQSCGSIQ